MTTHRAPLADAANYAVYILSPQADAQLAQRLAEALAQQGLHPPASGAAASGGSAGADAAAGADALEILGRDCLKMRMPAPPGGGEALRAPLAALSERWQVDLVCLPEDAPRDAQRQAQEDPAAAADKRLLVFDMDSTLIQMEMIDALAECAGAGDKVAAITDQAMNGAIDFRASLRQRVALLRGLSEDVLPQLAQRMPLQRGARRLFAALRERGWRSAIVSGGFVYFGRILCEQLHIPYLFANELEIHQGVLTGRIKGEIVDGAAKLRHTRAVARREGVDMSRVVAVGDGANDLPMLLAAGMGIAFHAKPSVRRQAPHNISRQGLDSILYLLGAAEGA